VAAPRTHSLIPHTADAGFTAAAPGVSALFEEAALALSELSFDIDPGLGPTSTEAIELAAGDVVGLAFAWLNELIGLTELHRAALLGTSVHIRAPDGDAAAAGEWTLRAVCDLRRFAAGGARPRRPPKSATFHGLTVRPAERGWEMVAYLDV
jgi:SHS2 domain-containing protein